MPRLAAVTATLLHLSIPGVCGPAASPLPLTCDCRSGRPFVLADHGQPGKRWREGEKHRRPLARHRPAAHPANDLSDHDRCRYRRSERARPGVGATASVLAPSADRAIAIAIRSRGFEVQWPEKARSLSPTSISATAVWRHGCSRDDSGVNANNPRRCCRTKVATRLTSATRIRANAGEWLFGFQMSRIGRPQRRQSAHGSRTGRRTNAIRCPGS